MFHRNHEDNLRTAAMFDDERFTVRIWVPVLFDEIRVREPDALDQGVP